MSKAELFEQERVVAKHICDFLGTRERRDGVTLWIVMNRLSYDLIPDLEMGCTYGDSHYENWVLELGRAELGKPLNGTDWPSIQSVPEEAIVNTSPEGAPSCAYPSSQIVPT